MASPKPRTGRAWSHSTGGLGWLLLLALGLAPAQSQTVTPLVPLTGHSWRYSDTATDFGAAWRAASFPAENSWPSGTALFGVESSSPYPYPSSLSTALVLNAGRTTYYFRTHFSTTGPGTNILLLATAYVDDGAVFYLNGVEAGRVRLPAGPISFGTKANLAFPEGGPVVLEFPADSLLPGDNVLGVEVHQASDTSSDVVFGMSLESYTLEAPALTNPSEPVDRSLPQGGETTLEVFAAGYPALSYLWFKNGSLLPSQTGPSFTLVNVSAADAGSYYAVATNRAGSVTSRVASVTVLADVTAPKVLYAIGLPNGADVRIVFSEPVDQSIAQDNFNWSIEVAGSGPILTTAGRLEDGTNLVLTAAEPRLAGVSYTATSQVPIPDLYGNELPLGTVIPIALFDTLLVPNTEAHHWRYHQLGIDLGTDWIMPAYEDGSWLVGSSPFDAFRSFAGGPACRPFFPVSREPIRTCLTLSNANATAQIPAIYFRTHFGFQGDVANAVLRLDTILNDGAVFYLNGVELLRVGMPDGAVAYDTLASRLADDAVPEQFEAPAPSLVVGDNLLAVELHQHNLTSPDLTLALQMTGLFPTRPVVQPPQLFVQRRDDELTISWSPTTATLEAADSLVGPWGVVVPNHPPGRHVTITSDPQRFYRAVLP